MEISASSIPQALMQRMADSAAGVPLHRRPAQPQRLVGPSSRPHRVALRAPSPAHDTFAFRSGHVLDFLGLPRPFVEGGIFMWTEHLVRCWRSLTPATNWCLCIINHGLREALIVLHPTARSKAPQLCKIAFFRSIALWADFDPFQSLFPDRPSLNNDLSCARICVAGICECLVVTGASAAVGAIRVRKRKVGRQRMHDNQAHCESNWRILC
jgi:hypothetical protein